MKINLISIGKNKIQAIKVIREYSGMSLESANKISENTPVEFIVKQPYDRIHEIISTFESIGCKINIETGHSTEMKKSNELSFSKKPNVTTILLEKSEESKDKVTINNSKEAEEYLINRQDLNKAITGGIIASIILSAIVISFLTVNPAELSSRYTVWLYNLLIGLVIGYTIKIKGRGVLPKFGVLASGLTIITAIAIMYVTYIVLIVKKGIWVTTIFSLNPIEESSSMLPIVLAAFMSYFVAFIKIRKIESSSTTIYDLSKADISEHIEAKRNAAKRTYTSHQKQGKPVAPKKEISKK